jgi:hypothetical protein
MTSEWSEKDRNQLQARGIPLEVAAQQIRMLREPRHFPCLVRPCTIGDGIQQLAEDRHGRLIELHRRAADQGRWTKFVPASGAASRMFALKGEGDLERLAGHLQQFAFYDDLVSAANRKGTDLQAILTNQEHSPLRELLLDAAGLGYEELPKALLPFHRYGDGSRTAFEEHLREAACCFADQQQRCRAHFTVAPEHRERFETLLTSLLPALRGERNVDLEVGFSQQKPSTDLLALDQDDQPLRTETGELVFRPGGHGALLDNLDDLGADLVFVKNIDNVAHARWQADSEHWIGVLGGCLIQMQTEVQRCLMAMEAAPDPQACREIERWIRDTFPGLVNALPAADEAGLPWRAMERLLHRPLRVCGVVLNEGEPGGGPFWVREADGSHSLQIVESAEVAVQETSQQEIFAAATHFNPVLMALALRDHHHDPFPLPDYVDRQRFLVTSKPLDGHPVRVLERPGLWNGSMAAWNTVFVEVPKEVFTPVKTVFDLLRPEHQP